MKASSQMASRLLLQVHYIGRRRHWFVYYVVHLDREQRAIWDSCYLSSSGSKIQFHLPRAWKQNLSELLFLTFCGILPEIFSFIEDSLSQPSPQSLFVSYECKKKCLFSSSWRINIWAHYRHHLGRSGQPVQWVDNDSHDMVWHGEAWYGIVRHGMGWHGELWHSMVWHSEVWYGMVRHGMLWHVMTWWDMA